MAVHTLHRGFHGREPDRRLVVPLVLFSIPMAIAIHTVPAFLYSLFLHGAEIFKAYYSASEHLVFTRYLWSGVGEHRALVPFTWLGLGCSLLAFLILLVPRTRRRFWTLNVGCVLVWVGVYVEKGMGLVVAGMTPDALGEIYEYTPSWTELLVAAGVFAVGSLVFLALVKIAAPILHGSFRAGSVLVPIASRNHTP